MAYLYGHIRAAFGGSVEVVVMVPTYDSPPGMPVAVVLSHTLRLQRPRWGAGKLTA